MHSSLPSILLLLLLNGPGATAARSSSSKAPQKILLSTVSSLTLRANQLTTGRRSAPIQQLICEGPACPFHTIDTLRCTNAGSSYGGSEDVEWTCTASLPSAFKLGATDVQCEGYDSPEDPHVLRGSCGVTYRLLFTEEGEQRYADEIAERQRSRGWWGSGDSSGKAANGLRSKEGDAGAALFWVLFVGVVLWMAYRACTTAQRTRRNRRSGGGRRPGGGGGGGGGGSWPPSDPPPYDEDPRPYDSHRGKPSTSSAFSGWGRGGAARAWQPGFWTGALGGAAAGYAAGQGRRSAADRNRARVDVNFGRNNGEGSSRSGSSGGGWGGGASYEGTGFGGTSRR